MTRKHIYPTSEKEYSNVLGLLYLNPQETIMGLWSNLFPGIEGSLADIFWSESGKASGGIILANENYPGTNDDDTIVFGQKSFYYNPYNSIIDLKGGNDAVEFQGTASGVTIKLGGGDLNVLKSLEGFRYSKLSGSSGSDLFLFKPSGWNIENLFHSELDSSGGDDTLILAKDNNEYAYNELAIDSSRIDLGAGDDRLFVDAHGRFAKNSKILLGSGDDEIVFIDTSQKELLLGGVYIDGGAGDDTFDLTRSIVKRKSGLILKGGGGFDTLIVESGFDYQPYKKYFESILVDGKTVHGPSTIILTSTGSLPSSIKNLILSGSKHLKGYGHRTNNRLTGNSGNNLLDGKGGADVMAGRKGNDTYIVDNAKDVVSEGSGAGTDTVKASVSYRLSANVERLILTGTKAINGTGNGLNNRLTGNSAHNVLNGGGGNDAISGGGGEDILIGGTGKDTMTGGTGADTFTYKKTFESGTDNTLRDVITDFNGSDGDRIDLSAIDAFSGSTGNQAFTYIGSNPFSGTRGEVRFASGILRANTGIDTVADMQIKLTGVTSFSETFLVL